MKREIVLTTTGGRVLTGSSLRPVAGNLGFAPGQAVYVFDGVVLGQKRTQSRPKPFATVTTPLPIGYRFADASALKMYYTNVNFEVQRTEDITPPFEGAALALHCYNESAEYLVWFINSRCIVQKNSLEIADFTSAFYYAPDEVEANIDSNGDLIWGAAGAAIGIYTMALYKNGSLITERSYSEDSIETMCVERIKQRTIAVEFSATVTPYAPTTETSNVISVIPRNMVVYQASYAGCRISQSEWAVDGSASAGNPLYDLLAADALIPVSSYGSVFIAVWIDAHGTGSTSGGDGLTIMDESHENGGVSTQLNNVAIFRHSNGSLVAECQSQSGPSDGTVTDTEYDVTVTEAYNAEPEEFTCYVSTQGTWLNNANEFTVRIPSIGYLELITSIMQNYYFPVSGRVGENSGVTRNAKINGIVENASHRYYHFVFDAPWPEEPQIDDTFIMPAYRGIETVERTNCSVHISLSFPSINTSGGEIITDRGNGFATTKMPKIENVFGWVSQSGALLRNGVKVYDAPQYQLLDGAWSTGPMNASGVAAGKIITVNGNAVATYEPNFNPSVVTKQFTEVTI